ncbi:hypothetical protein C922_04885 [Plasmodium inui San Antonio 1]|uniref:Uncharacterized protein n=1 Tax=Plasmodium inui San Antonio 1 TaxID=1237626 RepID=W7AHJ4_9APIC|nr:hypothetical protein C922_04885 [Plasmodium inui San Antonio 1]EUD64741.1 hypothetical protein C922_04885 [Plasmodium inui San Antonio 1]
MQKAVLSFHPPKLRQHRDSDSAKRPIEEGVVPNSPFRNTLPVRCQRDDWRCFRLKRTDWVTRYMLLGGSADLFEQSVPLQPVTSTNAIEQSNGEIGKPPNSQTAKQPKGQTAK